MHNEICEICGEREYDEAGEPTHIPINDAHDFSHSIDYCISCGLLNFLILDRPSTVKVSNFT